MTQIGDKLMKELLKMMQTQKDQEQKLIDTIDQANKDLKRLKK